MNTWLDKFDLGLVIIVGGGISGQATLTELVPYANQVIVVEDSATELLRQKCSELGVPIIESNDSRSLDEKFAAATLVVMSPGIPHGHLAYQYAAKYQVSLTTELELGYKRLGSNSKIIAVTGTNGKTTVTSLIARMLRESGFHAIEAGNIGTPLISISLEDNSIVVAEVSSFQLALIDDFKPNIAIWLNLSEDHLDIHRDFEDYALSKARIFKNMDDEGVAIVNCKDEKIMKYASSYPVRKTTFGCGSADARLEGDQLIFRDEVIMSESDLARSFPHDIENALAACAGAICGGASRQACTQVLKDFKGMPHRIEFVDMVSGVDFYDDSKATTPASVNAALSGFESVILIIGGRDKSLDFAIVKPNLHRVKKMITFGESAGKLYEMFAGVANVEQVANLEQAVQKAFDSAIAGDTVLLSPGCASFDHYSSYAQRGEHFRELVSQLCLVNRSNNSEFQR